jgi:hypothetical protein
MTGIRSRFARRISMACKFLFPSPSLELGIFLGSGFSNQSALFADALQYKCPQRFGTCVQKAFENVGKKCRSLAL